MSFETNIKTWVSTDNEIKKLNDRLKILREHKSKLHNEITNYITNNNMENSSVQISDGRLKLTYVKTQQPLTFKYLEDSLSEIIKDKSQVNAIINHIKVKRETKIIPEIKRYYNN
jgi:predicted  nucleic acid-binding Zn-ribbon protein